MFGIGNQTLDNAEHYPTVLLQALFIIMGSLARLLTTAFLLCFSYPFSSRLNGAKPRAPSVIYQL
jgi:hypothetical protein